MTIKSFGSGGPQKRSCRAVVCAALEYIFHNLGLALADSPLWSRDSIVATRLEGLSSIPCRVNFPGWGFSGVFLNCKTNIGKLRPHPSSDIIDQHNHHMSFHMGASNFRCRRALKPKILGYILLYSHTLTDSSVIITVFYIKYDCKHINVITRDNNEP